MKALAILLLGLCSTAFAEKLGNVFGKVDVPKFIEEADSITLYSLDPDPEDERPEKERAPADRVFHGYRILGSVAGDSKALKERIRSAIVAAFSNFYPEPYECFDPRHAVRLIRRGEQLDILICYQCRQSCAYFDGKMQFGPIGPGGQLEFDALLDEKKVQRDIPKEKKPNQAPEPTAPSGRGSS